MAKHQGLSPRVRGNLQRFAAYARGERSIPASAGEPTPMPCVRSSLRVYPRECGGTMTPSEFTPL